MTSPPYRLLERLSAVVSHQDPLASFYFYSRCLALALLASMFGAPRVRGPRRCCCFRFAARLCTGPAATNTALPACAAAALTCAAAIARSCTACHALQGAQS
jgi:hypothetical protein